MSLGMYDASVPVFVKMLGNLSNILDKGKAYCEAKKVDQAVLANTRLIPDMFPLWQQVQIATSHPQWCCSLLSGQERQNYPNLEPTLDGMKQRIASAIDFVKGFKKEQIDGSEARQVKMVFPAITFEFPGQTYLLNFVMPNVYFHVTTSYNILRSVGIEVGKRDFTGV